MKRYYSIDYEAMKKYGLDLTDWIILENVHYIQAISDSGYCEKARKDLADHHNLSTDRLKKRISDLVDRKLLKRNTKNHVKTTSKWHEIIGVKNNPIDNLEGVKNNPAEGYKQPEEGVKNNPTLPIRENLVRDREYKNTKSDFKDLLEEIKNEAPRKSKIEFTEKGYKAYLQIEDKSKIKEHYLAHQEQSGQYAQRIAGFLLDYDTYVKDLKGSDTFNLSGKNYLEEEF